MQCYIISYHSMVSRAGLHNMREMGGAPRNPAPRNHLLVRIVKPSGCHCTEWHLTSGALTEDQQQIVECRPPLGALPPSPNLKLS